MRLARSDPRDDRERRPGGASGVDSEKGDLDSTAELVDGHDALLGCGWSTTPADAVGGDGVHLDDHAMEGSASKGSVRIVERDFGDDRSCASTEGGGSQQREP